MLVRYIQSGYITNIEDRYALKLIKVGRVISLESEQPKVRGRKKKVVKAEEFK